MTEENTETKLGKIRGVRYGHGGYQGCQMGITFDLGADGWGVGDFWGFWGVGIKHTENCKWTEDERIKHLGETSLRISQLLKDANVDTVDQLDGIPVEVTFENFNSLASWRVLSEVI